MAITCDVILQWSATPEQLTNLGTALWRWGCRAAGATAIYQHLDNQPLADLIAGKLPPSSNVSSQIDQRGFHFRFRIEACDHRLATMDWLRREMLTAGVEDIIVDGASWRARRTSGSRAGCR
jgi:hypothetical protein